MELATPISVYWDLPPVVDDVGHLKRICDDIIKLRPLMLQLKIGDSQQEDVLLALFTTLNESQIGVSLSVPAGCLPHWKGNLFSEFRLKELLICSENFSELTGLTATVCELSEHAPAGTVLGLSIMATRENWRDLPSYVEFCRTNALKRLVLPMQRLYDNELPFLLSKADQCELQNALAAVGGVADINLTIHDPFLWRAFNPGIPFPQGGCQAANTMIAISRHGDVYPCPTLPVIIGTIGEMTLKEIVASPSKKEFRRKLLEMPSGCCDCAEVSECRGGCRGRAYVQHGTLDGIDSACQ
jgi:GeoRSP system SPASM domain protein